MKFSNVFISDEEDKLILETELNLRMLQPEKVDCLLKKAGFEKIVRFGSFKEEEFNKDSGLQLLLAKN